MVRPCQAAKNANDRHFVSYFSRPQNRSSLYSSPLVRNIADQKSTPRTSFNSTWSREPFTREGRGGGRGGVRTGAKSGNLLSGVFSFSYRHLSKNLDHPPLYPPNPLCMHRPCRVFGNLWTSPILFYLLCKGQKGKQNIEKRHFTTYFGRSGWGNCYFWEIVSLTQIALQL